MSIDSNARSAPTPSGFDGPRIALYTEEYAADPHRAHRDMLHRFGSLAPVELAPGVPATLVIGYHAAVRILNDPDRFTSDPRGWEQNIPADCPIRPMMEWYPNPLHSGGLEHIRYRSATAGALGKVDLHRLHGTVEQIATPLIDTFCADGHCDVVGQYALPVAFATLNAILGCPADIGQRAAIGMAAIFDTVGAADGNQMLLGALAELIRIKRSGPAEDVTSWLVEHPARLDDEEMVCHLALLYAAGIEPTQNLIVNTLLLMLTDGRFAGNVLDGSLSTRDALDEVLFNSPPLANYCIRYPRQPILIEDVWLPAHQPVLISMTACNNDPAVRTGNITDNRSHLAFGTGPHGCPARSMTMLIVQNAIDQLLDALPELALSIPREELRWRPGPFHRSLVSLPVTFPPSAPIQGAGMY
ncbi:cytochrome P450 [Nocardia cyriacigeorgica]|uniref:Cytochrome P450 n=1 Tax=Nocardia cyriacigeorgica TaxID=135487 RepID=A0A6P1CYP8_9NOCA|nr:cytochrome P450 [Nocardia cyriacigeorgica]NEW37653.1 cytochrome P450 [Nocardia cyriacigeorgica]NEW43246.1 cytochrome P450 [Nocardia cyriacigeorgica]NEW48959.1 cytochrome P450 [Nocardia cyriacigeorgica]NEW55060.1 cytochrome P450 [Nocardia cyriacigeorgica]